MLLSCVGVFERIVPVSTYLDFDRISPIDVNWAIDRAVVFFEKGVEKVKQRAWV